MYNSVSLLSYFNNHSHPYCRSWNRSRNDTNKGCILIVSNRGCKHNWAIVSWYIFGQSGWAKIIFILFCTNTTKLINFHIRHKPHNIIFICSTLWFCTWGTFCCCLTYYCRIFWIKRSCISFWNCCFLWNNRWSDRTYFSRECI